MCIQLHTIEYSLVLYSDIAIDCNNISCDIVMKYIVFNMASQSKREINYALQSNGFIKQ